MGIPICQYPFLIFPKIFFRPFPRPASLRFRCFWPGLFCVLVVDIILSYYNTRYRRLTEKRWEVQKLAGNSNSGVKCMFSLSESQLKSFLEDYKKRARDGEYAPSWPHLCGELGYTEREVAQVIALAENPISAYRDRGVMLKRMATWMRGQMLSCKAWQGPAQSKAIFALKQDVGDGYRYSDSDRAGASGPVSVSVSFGDGDKRSGKASK